jgi:hypothetical protein
MRRICVKLFVGERRGGYASHMCQIIRRGAASMCRTEPSISPHIRSGREIEGSIVARIAPHMRPISKKPTRRVFYQIKFDFIIKKYNISKGSLILS